MLLPWIDTHCHLDAAEFAADREAVLARAASLRAIVVPAVAPEHFQAVRGLVSESCEQGPSLFYALGVHPLFISKEWPAQISATRTAITQSLGECRFVAVGEIGLDDFVPGLDKEAMLLAFRAQLAIAADLHLPVILHVRRAVDLVLRELRRFRPPGGIAHAFNGSAQQAEAFLKLGFVLGFGGASTFTRALRLRGLLQTLGDEAIVLETDAPDIPPAWLGAGRGSARNEPGELLRIGETLAQVRNCGPEQLARDTARNAYRVLPRLAAGISHNPA